MPRKKTELPWPNIYDEVKLDFPNPRPIKELVETVLKLHRKELTRRLQADKETKAKMGHKPAGKANYGYKWDNINKKRVVTVNPKEAEVVKSIFDMKSKGYRQTDIARHLNSKNILTRSNKLWEEYQI